jgi:Tol biopolymer transport system component
MRNFLLSLLAFVPLVACRSTHPTEAPFSPAVFAPDGSAIVFSLARADSCLLFRADIASGAMRRIDDSTSGCESDPTFSSDGQHLAFMRAPRNGARASLIVSRPDETDARTLVSNEEDNLQPAFVPHSDQILFLRSGAFEHHSPLVDNRRHKFDLFSVDLSKGNVTALTHQNFYEVSHVSVSADGKQILMTVSTYPEGDHFLISGVSKSQVPAKSFQPRVPNAPNSGPVLYNAVWLPDGKSFLFSAATEPPGGGNFDYNVYRLTIGSGAIEKLTELTGLLDGFSVSADGKKAVLLHQGVYSVLDLGTHKLTAIPLRIQ